MALKSKMIQNQGNWVPLKLNPINVERQFFVCEQLLKRHYIVTEDEKWVHCENHLDTPAILRGPNQIFTAPKSYSVFGKTN